MKGLSLWQPWASLIALGEKRIETRSWGTSYRGPIAIHATQRFWKENRELCREEPFATALLPLFFGHPHRTRSDLVLPLGAIVAVAELVDVLPTRDLTLTPGSMTSSQYDPTDSYFQTGEHEAEFGDFSPGRYAWLLTNVRCLPKPISCKGALGLWDVPTEIESQINEVLKR